MVSSFAPFLLFCALVSAQAKPPHASMAERAKGQSPDIARRMLARQEALIRFFGADRLARGLGLGPGLRVLDVGSGAGGFAYFYAERLAAGGGSVAAAEIMPGFVEFMRAQASERGLRNLEPVLVRPDGGDGFYRNNRFDLIVCSHMLFYLSEPVRFLRELRASLKPGGRLAVLHYSDMTPFDWEKDVTDWSGLIQRLSREPASSPLLADMHPFTRKALGEHAAHRCLIPAHVFRLALGMNLNKLLASQSLHRSFRGPAGDWKKELGLAPVETAHIAYLLDFLDSDGSLSKAPGDLTRTDLDIIVLLNKTLVAAALRPYLYGGGPPPFLPGTRAESRDTATRVRIRTLLERAGYRLVSDSDELPFRVLMLSAASEPN